jgi:MoaA/NifB/PqqE/SkfB family radical SAM enzyme
MRRLELHLTYTCPEKCVFCSEDTRMRTYKRFPVTWGRVARTLREHAARGVDHLHITGGEPTIHPRFLDVLVLAKKLGMRTSIGTIGTMLSRPDFAEKAMPYLDEALFSIHGPNAAVHDPLTRTVGSFDKQLRALELARSLRPDFRAAVNTVVCSETIEQLPDTVSMLDGLGIGLIIISNTTPEGAAEDDYERLAVPLDALARVLPTVPERANRAVLRFFGIPMCLLGAHRMLSNDLHWDPRVTVEWTTRPGKVAFEGHYSWTPMRKRTHVEQCNDCTMKPVCMGIYARYAELWPTDGLRAL